MKLGFESTTLLESILQYVTVVKSFSSIVQQVDLVRGAPRLKLLRPSLRGFRDLLLFGRVQRYNSQDKKKTGPADYNVRQRMLMKEVKKDEEDGREWNQISVSSRPGS